MRLRLDLCDVDVRLKNIGWHKSELIKEADDNWCNVELSLKSKYIDYDTGGRTMLMNTAHCPHVIIEKKETHW